MSKELAATLYGLLGVIAAALTAFSVELGRGTVPLPAEYGWTLPILSAAIVAATAAIRKLTGDE